MSKNRFLSVAVITISEDRYGDRQDEVLRSSTRL